MSNLCRFFYFSCFVIIAVVSSTRVTNEFFTAASDMEILHKVEKKLATKFLKYIKKEEERLEMLEREIQIIEKTLPPKRRENKTDEAWLSQVTNSHGLLRRMTTFWPEISKLSKTNTTKYIMESLQTDVNKLKIAYPENEDLRGALTAIIRIQDTYNITPAQFIDGLGFSNTHILTIEEIFEIGFLCVGLEDYFHAREWLKQAWYKFPPKAMQVGFLDKPSLIEYLAWTEYQMGNLEDAIKYTKHILKLNPAHKAARINLELFKEDLFKSKTDPTIRKVYRRHKHAWANRHNRLCRGAEKMEQHIVDKLHCKYSQDKPQFILKPLKMEYVYYDPEIIIYHDLLRDHEMDHIKKIATPLLNRATVHDPKTGMLTFADYRISKSAWIKPEMDEVAARIMEKVGYITGLDMRYAEELQIQNYGIGGQYEPHYDHATIESPRLFKKYGGNRIATMLMYISEVSIGGKTVFTNTGPGVAISPEKGSGIFWYNLHKNGTGNPKTQHAGCPMVLGQKWVSNLWIHAHGQEFIRQCSWNKNE